MEVAFSSFILMLAKIIYTKKYKLLTIILVVPYYFVFSNFILRDFGIDNNWRVYVFLIPILFLCFILFSYKYGIFGVRFRFERYKFAYENIFNYISDSFIALNQNLKVIEINKMFFENFIGAHKKYKNLDEILADCPQLAEYKDSLIEIINKSKQGDFTTIEILISTKHENIYFDVQANPIVSYDEYFGTILMFKDISAHKK